MTAELALQTRQWAENEDYTQGLRLWAQRYGENIGYKALCMGPNDFNRAKMRRMLLDGLPDSTPEQPRVATPVAVEAIRSKPTETPKKPNSPQTPPEVVAWRAAASQHMDERTLLKQRLRELPDPAKRAERATTAGRIVELTEALDELFGRIGYWEQWGRVPSTEVPAQAEPPTTYPREYLNLRTYVSRSEKKLLKEADPERRARLHKQIEDWKARMGEIEITL